MPRKNTSYLLKALAPDVSPATVCLSHLTTSSDARPLLPQGERQGVVDDSVLDRQCIDPNDSSGWLNSSFPCPPQTRHGYFETSPNVDAVALRVTSPDLAEELMPQSKLSRACAPVHGRSATFQTTMTPATRATARKAVRLPQLKMFRLFPGV